MTAHELFQAGRLNESIDVALQQVKSNPKDLETRFFLAELAAFAGDWDRADRQLDAIIQQTTEGAMLSMTTRQLIRGELQREQVFFDGRAPELVVPLSRDAEIALELCTALRLGQNDDVATLATDCENARVYTSGRCNDSPFTSFRDLDDRLAGVLEVITTTGKYFWVPMSKINSLVFEPPKRPMDLIWRKVEIEVADGPQGEVYIPARYPARFAEMSDAEKLGRATDWIGSDGSAVVGKGLKMFLVDESDMSIMELKSLEFGEAQS